VRSWVLLVALRRWTGDGGAERCDGTAESGVLKFGVVRSVESRWRRPSPVALEASLQSRKWFVRTLRCV
jgi:hypothetical protein